MGKNKTLVIACRPYPVLQDNVVDPIFGSPVIVSRSSNRRQTSLSRGYFTRDEEELRRKSKSALLATFGDLEEFHSGNSSGAIEKSLSSHGRLRVDSNKCVTTNQRNLEMDVVESRSLSWTSVLEKTGNGWRRDSKLA